MSAKILIIEDETEIRQFFELLLGRDGYQVRGASSAEMGLTLLQEDMPDLIVLDWMLPGMSGLEFVGKLHQDGHLAPPVLMVTARADNASVVAGLKAGADDYLTKPFDPSILRVRVEALLRRKNWLQDSSQSLLKFGDFQLDWNAYRLRGPDGEIPLTASEFKLLCVLVKKSGKVFSRDDLILQIQGEGINVSGRTIDTHIFTLRKKLGAMGDFIETVRGVGYRLKILPGAGREVKN